MEKKISVHIITNTSRKKQTYNKMFESEGFVIADGMMTSDIVVFAKQGDLNPLLYGKRPGDKDDKFLHHINGVQETIIDLFMYNSAQKKFKVGFEHGSLLLATLSNCEIIDVENHKGLNHNVHLVNNMYNGWYESDHSQLMYPYSLPKDNFEILGTSKLFSKYYASRLHNKEEKIEPLEDDVEICHFNTTNSLCITPNITAASDMGKKMIFSIIKKKYNDYKTSRNSLFDQQPV